jgi:hypothetical protein
LSPEFVGLRSPETPNSCGGFRWQTINDHPACVIVCDFISSFLIPYFSLREIPEFSSLNESAISLR